MLLDFFAPGREWRKQLELQSGPVSAPEHCSHLGLWEVEHCPPRTRAMEESHPEGRRMWGKSTFFWGL